MTFELILAVVSAFMFFGSLFGIALCISAKRGDETLESAHREALVRLQNRGDGWRN